LEPKTINERSALNKFDNQALIPKDLFVHIYKETIEELNEICGENLKATEKTEKPFSLLILAALSLI
jgi:hypothetical protein